jgi:hypothetical protein
MTAYPVSGRLSPAVAVKVWMRRRQWALGGGKRVVSTGQRLSGYNDACYTSPRTEQGALHLQMRTPPTHCRIVQRRRS